MPKKTEENQLDEQQGRALPTGVTLLRTLKGHVGAVNGIAFNPSGEILASGSSDNTVMLWDVSSGRLLRTLEEHEETVWSVAFDPSGENLACGSGNSVKLWDVASGRLLRTLTKGHNMFYCSVTFDQSGKTLVGGSGDNTVKLWDVASRRLLRTLEGHKGYIYSVAFDPSGEILASGSRDGTVKLWDASSGRLLRTLEERESIVWSIAFDPSGKFLASGNDDGTVKLWDVASGRLLRTLENHIAGVIAVTFYKDGQSLASKSDDGTLRLWSCETWESYAVIPEPTDISWLTGIAFHPNLPLLASVGSNPDDADKERSTLIHIWELDFDVLLGKASGVQPTVKAVHHTTAKIVLVGDSGVGKTGLGWRLAHGEFKEHSSTHGQQFWILDELSKRRDDGTECEAILWDLAGQPDYRLTHALFLDDADLALLLFDPTDSRDPLHGVEFWLKQLKAGQMASAIEQGAESVEKQKVCPTILVGGRADRGDPRLTQEELDEYCLQRGISGGYLSTSAKEEIGLDELLRRMKEQIPWEQKSATVTTVTFKRIKDYVLGLKENPRIRKVIVSPQDLRKRLEKIDKSWKFTDAEMMTAVGHLANYGYVRVLRTSKGEERILLVPELLNNLAASFVLEARRNPKGLGSLEEQKLMAGEYQFRELEKVYNEEKDILLDSAALLFLKHNVCFRETDLGGRTFLVFPELINLKKPLLEDEQTEDGVAYTVSGAIENVYASLVVLLGYTQTFTRTNQWRNQARYEVGDGLICGFRQDEEREGELNLVLYFARNVGRPVRMLFQGLFEGFLARRNLNVFRYEPVICSNGHMLNRAVVREQLRDGFTSSLCYRCGEKLTLPKTDEPIRLTQTQRRKVEEQHRVAARRSRFEQVVFQLASYIQDQKLKRPECFISYAWGDKEQERWVEHNLATDLQKAGISVLLDRWENARVGASVMRFMERIEECDKLIVVGTPVYRKKYANKETEKSYVLATEGEMVALRKLGVKEQRESVLPVLLEGDERASFPLWLQGHVYADFRVERSYFATAFDLILSIYNIAPNAPAVADLRESLREFEMR